MTKFKIIETHITDQSPEFIKLYNQCYTKQQIQEQLGIGKTAYYNYYRQNQDKLKRTKKCLICGKTFPPKQIKQKYCSLACQKKVKYQRDKKRGKYVLQRNTKTTQKIQ